MLQDILRLLPRMVTDPQERYLLAPIFWVGILPLILPPMEGVQAPLLLLAVPLLGVFQVLFFLCWMETSTPGHMRHVRGHQVWDTLFRDGGASILAWMACAMQILLHTLTRETWVNIPAALWTTFYFWGNHMCGVYVVLRRTRSDVP